MADDIDDAQTDMDKQVLWGMSLTDMALFKFIRGGRAMRQRIIALEARVTALEGRTRSGSEAPAGD